MKATRVFTIDLIFLLLLSSAVAAKEEIIPLLSSHLEQNLSYEWESFVDCLSLAPNWAQLTINDWEGIKNRVSARMHRKSERCKAMLAENIAWIKAPDAEQTKELIIAVMVEEPYLWKVVSLIDYFSSKQGWFDLVQAKGLWGEEDIIKKINDIFGETRKLSEVEDTLRGLLKPYLSDEMFKREVAVYMEEPWAKERFAAYLSDELLNTSVVCILLGKAQEKKEELSKAIKFCIEKKEYQPSCIRWVSLVPAGVVPQSEYDIIIKYFSTQGELSYEIRRLLLRMIGLKMEDTPFIDELSKGAVVARDINDVLHEKYKGDKNKVKEVIKLIAEKLKLDIIDTSKWPKAQQINDPEMYTLSLMARQYIKFRRCTTKEQQLEFLKNETVLDRNMLFPEKHPYLIDATRRLAKRVFPEIFK